MIRVYRLVLCVTNQVTAYYDPIRDRLNQCGIKLDSHCIHRLITTESKFAIPVTGCLQIPRLNHLVPLHLTPTEHLTVVLPPLALYAQAMAVQIVSLHRFIESDYQTLLQKHNTC
jgi:hypothetical protein